MTQIKFRWGRDTIKYQLIILFAEKVWKRNNGKFVNFFRSFIGHKPPKDKTGPRTQTVFGSELTKLLADTGDEGEIIMTGIDDH